MLRKTMLVLSAVLAVSLTAGGVALAQEVSPEFGTPPHRHGLGQITALGDASITVRTLWRGEQTLQVTEDTEITDLSGKALAFADLQVGDWLAGRAERRDDGTIVAARLIRLASAGEVDGDLIRARGSITAVSDSSLTLDSLRRSEMTFTLNENTSVHPEGRALEVGARVLVIGVPAEDGSLVATQVLVHRRHPRDGRRHAGGKVEAVSDTSLTFTNRRFTLTVALNGETGFHSPDGSVASLAELQPGHFVRVWVQRLDDGSWLAKEVGAIASLPPDLPPADITLPGLALP